MAFFLKPNKFGRLQNWKMKRDQKKKSGERKAVVGEAEDIKQVWTLNEKEAYVSPSRYKRLPKFIVFFGAVVLLTAMIFWLLPAVVERFYGISNETPFEIQPELIYEKGTAVVSSSFANLMSEPDVGSQRVTQVLFNEPLRILDMSTSENFYHVQTTDQLKGYVLRTDVFTDAASAEPNLHKYKIVISDPVKRIMTHATKGTLQIEVMMNTVLFSDFKGDGVYRVSLPDGKTGWIGSSGVIELGIKEPLEKVGARYFVGSVENFHFVTLIDNGATYRGASVEGVVYVCAGINGLSMPRKMEDQFYQGEEIPLRYDAVTRVLDISLIQPGDLIFFRSPMDLNSTMPYEMGVYTDVGMVLMNHKSRTTLRICDLEGNEELKERVISVRRIFL